MPSGSDASRRKKQKPVRVSDVPLRKAPTPRLRTSFQAEILLDGLLEVAKRLSHALDRSLVPQEPALQYSW